MFKKQALIMLSVVLFVCLIFTFVACDPDIPPTPMPDKYTVTYDNGDDNATGTAPQVREYSKGDTVTVADNPFELAGHVFDGWTDGDTVYTPGQTFTMPEKDVTLTASWVKGWQGHKLVTIAEVLANIPDTESDEIEYKRYIDGIVKSIDNATFGQMTLQDETGEIMVYGTQSEDGSLRYDAMADKPVAGDYVVLYIQNIKNHQGKTKEINRAWIVHFEKPSTPDFDVNDYAQANVSEARAKAAGSKVLVEGVVAFITNANGMKPSGFYLVDGTGSIYVYDGQLAPQVKVGDKVKVAAERDNWILDSEQANAQSHGYTGCIQLANAHLVDKSASDQPVDYGWVTESTVKKIMDTPVTDNITTTIFKVNALVRKAPDSGFVNYYIDDIDGNTGSYVYTQCNGSDYTWLDEFDGKICTVYLSVINAKSTATGCVWRFVPVQVSDDGYKFDEKDAPQFALDYYAVEQFRESYQADPALEVLTSVNSELLGLGDITLSYVSDNEASVKFETSDGKTVMHTLAPGKANITITAQYKTYSAEAKVTVTVEQKQQYDAITVKQAIDAALASEVTVKGVVGPSLVNQVGFYLIDDTGVIAVLMASKETCAELTLGDLVTIKATRANKSKDGNIGQTYLDKAEVLLNEYGGHDYSTQTFVKGKTLSEIVNADKPANYTTVVYVVDVEIRVEGSNYSVKVFVKDGDTELLLYAGGGKQYSFVSQYDGQKVTVELALCDWNNKGAKGCVLSVTDSEGVKTVNTLNFS